MAQSLSSHLQAAECPVYIWESRSGNPQANADKAGETTDLLLRHTPYAPPCPPRASSLKEMKAEPLLVCWNSGWNSSGSWNLPTRGAGGRELLSSTY